MSSPKRKPPRPRCCALPGCGIVFTPARSDAKYCSDQCRWAAAKRAKRGRSVAVNTAVRAPAVTPARPAPVIAAFRFPATPATRSPKSPAAVDLAPALARRNYQVRGDAPAGGCQVSEAKTGPCMSPGPNRHGGIRLCDAHAYALGLPAPRLTG